ncbi:MAG: MarR family transcriptional regulator [Actinomycetota bacterium]|nr:MarR family transcriptional regulator [Actinomycetota bacterium]
MTEGDAPPEGDGARGHGEESANNLLLYVVRRLARAMGRASDDIAADHDVSLPELMMLLVLGEGGGFSGAQLARRTFVTPQSGHQVLTQLVERGLVDRRPDPSNRRTLTHELTEAGWDVAERCRDAVLELEERVLAGVPDDERRLLKPGLLHAATTIRGGWFGDEDAEARSADRRRLTPQARRSPSSSST